MVNLKVKSVDTNMVGKDSLNRNHVQPITMTGGLMVIPGHARQYPGQFDSLDSQSKNRFNHNMMLDQNPYNNIDGDDRTDFTPGLSSSQKGILLQRGESMGQHMHSSSERLLLLKKEEDSAFFDGSSVDMLEVLHAQPDYYKANKANAKKG